MYNIFLYQGNKYFNSFLTIHASYQPAKRMKMSQCSDILLHFLCLFYQIYYVKLESSNSLLNNCIRKPTIDIESLGKFS